MTINEQARIGEDVLSPVSQSERQQLLNDVQEWYEECAGEDLRYDWCDDEGTEYQYQYQYRSPVLIERTVCPTPEEWLSEQSGSQTYMGWASHSDHVFDTAIEVVREAYGRQFGEEWDDDDSANAEFLLYDWVKNRLRNVREETVDNVREEGVDWGRDGF